MGDFSLKINCYHCMLTLSLIDLVSYEIMFMMEAQIRGKKKIPVSISVLANHIKQALNLVSIWSLCVIKNYRKATEVRDTGNI